MLFLLSFVAYAAGNGLVTAIVDAPSGLAYVHAHKPQLALGGILIAIVHTLSNIGLAAVMLSILRQYNQSIAFGYFAAAIASTVMLMVGGAFLLLQIPLSDAFVEAGATTNTSFQTLSLLSSRGNFFAYQIGMAIWGCGGLLMSYLFYQARFVPWGIAVWGFIGYLIFIAGTIGELLSFPYGIALSLPGGLFEIFLSIWMIVKGVKYVGQPAAIGCR